MGLQGCPALLLWALLRVTLGDDVPSPAPSLAPTGTCGDTCLGATCDFWVERYGLDCDTLDAASGSRAWDATIDVHRRPAWLKRLAGVAPDQRELPRGVSKLAMRAGVHDTVLAAYRSASRVVESFRARTTFSSDGDGAPGTFADDLDGVLLEEPEEEEEATSPSLFVKE
jgi:hypothetical protein